MKIRAGKARARRESAAAFAAAVANTPPVTRRAGKAGKGRVAAVAAPCQGGRKRYAAAGYVKTYDGPTLGRPSPGRRLRFRVIRGPVHGPDRAAVVNTPDGRALCARCYAAGLDGPTTAARRVPASTAVRKRYRASTPPRAL